MLAGDISRVLLSDQVYELVRSSILDGTREPGSRLVESEIARQLSVSQAPVREALKRLVHEGLVTSIPRQGSYVTVVSEIEMSLAREARAQLERIGARSAAVESTEADFVRLRAIVQRMEAAVQVDDWATFRALDMEFHGSVIAVGGHAVLSRLWMSIEPILLSQRAIGNPAYSGSREELPRWHAELVDVLESRDTERAGEEFYLHASRP